MRTHLLRAALLAALAFAAPSGADATEFTPTQRAEIVQILRDALKSDPTILRDAVETMREDDGRAQDQATRRAIAANRDALIDPADPVAGNPRGDVTIVEFFDTRCPYCRKLEPAMGQLLRQDHGVRLVYKDLPILGPASFTGSRALLAAQRQEGAVSGAYEKLRAALMAPGADQSDAGIRAAAERIGLDWTRLRHDMDDPAIKARLDRNIALARKLNVQGTPGLIIGSALIPGAVDLADLQKAVADARTHAVN